MKIYRRGTFKDHGSSSIDFDCPQVKWNDSSKEVEITKNQVREFDGKSQHNYKISISLQEITEILAATAIAAKTSPNLFRDLPAESVRSLLTVQAAIIGPLPINCGSQDQST